MPQVIEIKLEKERNLKPGQNILIMSVEFYVCKIENMFLGEQAKRK